MRLTVSFWGARCPAQGCCRLARLGLWGWLCLWLTWPLPAVALDDAVARQTLRGLPGVLVAVEPLPPEAVQDGLRTEEIQTDVVQRLQRAGIRVLSEQQREQAPGKPLLYINVTTWKGLHANNTLYLFSIRVELQQEVALVREPTLRRLAPTWHVGSVGMTSASRLRTIRTFIGDFIDQFIQAYRAANPQP
ncbi:MAG: hypothetical protein KatS3mg131_3202 [Candidatus Tectimicrobiota bacterium]|nr:MAG: hypothetical protein KatS3mg131_3202 [Candidatus Tectomicrobia bacterium]